MPGVRKATASIAIAGTDATAALAPDLIEFEYLDTVDRQADSVSFTLSDKNLKYLRRWTIDKGMEVKASIRMIDWGVTGTGSNLDCGTLEVDTMDFRGPPNTLVVKATSIPITGSFKAVTKNSAWTGATLSSIANDVAKRNNMTVEYTAKENPTIKRVDQREQSDAKLLKRLCAAQGLSMHIQDRKIHIFDEEELESQAPFTTITYGVTPYMEFSFTTTAQDKAKSSRVSYLNPHTGDLTDVDFGADEPPEGVEGEVTDTMRVDSEDPDDIDPDDPEFMK